MRAGVYSIAAVMMLVLLPGGPSDVRAEGASPVIVEGEMPNGGWVYLRASVEDDTRFHFWHEFLGTGPVVTLGMDIRTQIGTTSDVISGTGARDGSYVHAQAGDMDIEMGSYSTPANGGWSLGRFGWSIMHVPGSDENEYHTILYSAGGQGRFNWTFEFEGKLLSLTKGTNSFVASMDDCPRSGTVVASPGAGIPASAVTVRTECSVTVEHGFYGAWATGGAAAGMAWRGPESSATATGPGSMYLHEPHAGRYDFEAAAWLGPLGRNLFVTGADIPDVLAPP